MPVVAGGKSCGKRGVADKSSDSHGPRHKALRVPTHVRLNVDNQSQSHFLSLLSSLEQLSARVALLARLCNLCASRESHSHVRLSIGILTSSSFLRILLISTVAV